MTSFIPPTRILMGPGPSNVHPRVLEAMARPTIGHLDPKFIELMDIGANALIFSVVNGVLLKPLPFANPDQLVGVWHVAPGVMARDLNQSPATYHAYRDEHVFQDIGMWADDEASVTGRCEPERVDALNATDGTLPLLGVRPALGRIFTPEDDAPGSAPTVVLSHDYWLRVFAGNPDVIGQSLVVDGEPTQIIGVLPEGFRFLRERPALVMPFRLNPAEVFVGNFIYQGLARLKPGTGIAQASADMARLIPGIPDRFPMLPGFSREMYTESQAARWHGDSLYVNNAHYDALDGEGNSIYSERWITKLNI